jgi:prolyl oligopeptidase
MPDEVVETLHGVRVPDPYRWLEDVDSERVRAWVEERNRESGEFLAKAGSRDEIRHRLDELWGFERCEPPLLRGGRAFMLRNSGLQSQNVLYWAESSDLSDAEPRVLIDPNELSDDGTVTLAGFAVSRDGRLLAYGLAEAGSDWQEWRVREVDTGEDRPDRIRWVKFSGAAWLPDGSGFYYSRFPEPKQDSQYRDANHGHQIWLHRLGTRQHEDDLVYERPDHPDWLLNARVSADGRFLVVYASWGTRPENGLFYAELPSDTSCAHELRVVELLGEFDASYDFVGNEGSRVWVLTDRDAPLSRLVQINLGQPEPEHWVEVIPEDADWLQAVQRVGDRLIALSLRDACSRVRIFDLEGSELRELELPGSVTALGFGGRPEDRETFYRVEGFARPAEVWRYDLDRDASELFHAPKVRFDPEDYTTEQVFFASPDGTRVPMFVTHRRDVVPGPDTPTYLYGYGGFNVPLTPTFSPATLVWMERGGQFVQVNLRGGREYGKPWHEAGIRERKQNVFDDFIAAAEWLIANGRTSTPCLGIGGGSNGGLLVGAVLMQRPELFGAAVPAVGVFDMLRFHRFTIGWAWISDYGSPDDEDDFRALLAYSPLHNVQPGTHYPPTLLTTGDHDDRVFPAHTYKFTAALREAQGGTAPILLRVDMRAGHGLGKPTGKLLDEIADRWAFLERVLGS